MGAQLYVWGYDRLWQGVFEVGCDTEGLLHMIFWIA